MSRVFFTSDLHFWHRNVIKHCDRPFSSVQEMNEALIEQWNAYVSDSDVVYVLGDVFFCGAAKSQEIISHLKGRKILVRGNHDQHSLTKLKTLFAEVHDRLELEIVGRKVLLSHYPYAPTKHERRIHTLKNFWKFWRKKKYMDLRYMDRRPENKGGWLLHGHVHTAWKVKGKQINVGVDQWGFRPVLLEEIEEVMLSKENK